MSVWFTTTNKSSVGCGSEFMNMLTFFFCRGDKQECGLFKNSLSFKLHHTLPNSGVEKYKEKYLGSP